jgi:hypothetical protein
LHGTGKFANETKSDTPQIEGLKALADRDCLLVLWPESPWILQDDCATSSVVLPNYCVNNPAQAQPAGDWPAYDDIQQHRGGPYPAMIEQAITNVSKSAHVAPDSTFLLGASNGGVMAEIMAVAYPELFAGAVFMATGEYNAADDLPHYLLATQTGGPDADQQGTVAYREMGTYARAIPILITWFTGDLVVQPVTHRQVLTQWLQVHDWLDDGKDNNSFAANQTRFGTIPNGKGYRFTCAGQPGTRAFVEELVMNYTTQDAGGPAHYQWPSPALGLPDMNAEVDRFLFGSRDGCQDGAASPLQP